jgi:hypothetical protein
MCEYRGSAKKVRGSVEVIDVYPHDMADNVVQKAIEKMKEVNQYFAADNNYTLCYPDGKKVDNLPSGDRPFTVEAYQTYKGKASCYLTLYLINNQGKHIASNVSVTNKNQESSFIHIDINKCYSAVDAIQPKR